MKYGGTLLAVRDIQASRKFYEELFGLELYQDYGINLSFTCGLSLQQKFGWLVGLPEEQIQWRSHSMELYFEEAEFDSFLEKLRAYPGIQLLGNVVEHTWGQRVVRFYDPDGHLIEVGEVMGMVIRRFLASGMSIEDTARRMDVSIQDLDTLLEEE